METPLLILTYIGVFLLLGIVLTGIAQRLRIANVLFLLLVGVAIGNMTYAGAPVVTFPPLFLTSIALLALVMIVFDSSAGLKIHAVRAYGMIALKLSMTFALFCLVFLSIATMLVFPEITTIFFALIFAAFMCGTDTAVVLFMFKGSTNRVLELLEVESVVNDPPVVLIPAFVKALRVLVEIFNSSTDIFLMSFSSSFFDFSFFFDGFSSLRESNKNL